jgi:four helix bundle protein
MGSGQWAVGSGQWAVTISRTTSNLKIGGFPSMKVKNFRELIAWQKSLDLVEETYQASKSFPKYEFYGLTSQIRRAAVSIPSNIAEGQGRDSTREFRHHLSIAYGSLCEVQTQIFIAQRLTYLKDEQVIRLLGMTDEVGRLINGLSNSLPQ